MMHKYKKGKSRRVTIRLTPPQHARLEFYCAENNLNMSNVIRDLIGGQLKQQKVPMQSVKSHNYDSAYLEDHPELFNFSPYSSQYWSAHKVAQFYGFATSTINKWRKHGRIPYIKLANGVYRYDIKKIRETMEVKNDS